LHALAQSNAEKLKEQGGHLFHSPLWSHNSNFLFTGFKVLFEVDATNLSAKPELQHIEYARIVVNFPHIGGKSKITKNRELLNKFFSRCVLAFWFQLGKLVPNF
jgi:hypothetical protein